MDSSRPCLKACKQASAETCLMALEACKWDADAAYNQLKSFMSMKAESGGAGASGAGRPGAGSGGGGDGGGSAKKEKSDKKDDKHSKHHKSSDKAGPTYGIT